MGLQQMATSTRALLIRTKETTPMTRSGSALVSLTVLPNVADDLRLLGWTTNRGFLNDAVADAVVELVERAIALGYGRRDRLIGIGIAGRRKIRIALIVNSALALSTSRLENLPGRVALKRMMAAMVEVFCDSFEQIPRRIMLDIDDTEDRVHGGQQLALFNAYYHSRCFQPIHIYEATTGKPVAIILRPRKTPDGAEAALVLRHVIGHIRARWPTVDIVVRGDSHYARPEAMAWCERKRIGYIFGLADNPALLGRVGDLAEDAALGRIGGGGGKVRRYGEMPYAGKSWKT